ncbi:Fungalysin/Thermolysin Propeptide Motif [Hydrocarboniphaga daqingensis]|uniref:Fungalysin/Thermolysin Propeptide Motif n=1 Tax=Hydrocarboniphaga daqingensis TaxID=490188 RepID=A0A1M5LHX4_9GAMM|nr:M36 family metallopeptidase [Hydrocarboniphaga daqingensis]SHG64722.1 Fungalysin/Thermolysin Propeptide Motif [Hydrocarboniphaga daqingensis]
MKLHSLWPTSAGLAMGLCAAHAGLASASAERLHNVDQYRADLAPRTASAAAPVNLGGVLPAQWDARMNKPTFLWAAAAEPLASVGAVKADELLAAQARAYLRSKAGELQLTEAMINDAVVTEAQYNGSNGPAIVRFKQRVNGIDVFSRRLNVMMDRSGKLVAISGYFATDYGSNAPTQFARSAAQAIGSAWSAIGGSALNAATLVVDRVQGDYQWFKLPALSGTGMAMSRAPRVKRIYYPRAGRLQPAYYVELWGVSQRSGSTAYGLVVAAGDGALLFRNNLEAEAAYTYRVFADASGNFQPFDAPLGNGYQPFAGTSVANQPPRVGVESKLVTLDHGPISTGDPWIAESGVTTTTGNNVDSYIDSGVGVFLPLVLPVRTPGDGFVAGTGDSRATATSTDTFDYPVVGDDDPAQDAAKNAANVNLFYVNNWLHDFWYDHGFNELAGNGQTSNFGRGGSEGDPIQAEGQDASGRNNANMATPADGSSPRMQMYLFDGEIRGEVRITAPDFGAIKFNGASFGPRVFDTSGEVGVAADLFDAPGDGCTGVETPPDPILGITYPLPNLIPDPNLAGKIALIDRGNCNFTSKALYATISGATAMVVVNNGDGDPTSMGNADVPLDIVSTDQVYQIPSIMIRKDDGQKIKDAIAAGTPVTMSLRREASIDRDGTFDNQVIAHEYFHHVSNRLVDDGSGLSNNQGGSMGEGWSDVASMILTVRPEDRQRPGNDRYQAPYGVGFFVTGDSYFAIRRVPYSTDTSKNPLTFKHIAVGEPLPADEAPIAYGTDGAGNAQVHASGEIWANSVWECYAALLNKPSLSFEQARGRMMDYLIAGLKMTPSSPTYTEARDGILAAAMAADMDDYARCAHGFAQRGMGKNAISPDRDSTDHVGVVEDFTEFAAVPVDPPPSGGGGGSGGSSGGGGVSTGGGGGGGAAGALLLAPMLLAAALRRRRASFR